MFNSIMHTRLSFFESTPVGRILNRFSKDLSAIEFNIPNAFCEFFAKFMEIMTSFGIILVTKPLFIFVILPIFFIFLMIQVKIGLFQLFNID